MDQRRTGLDYRQIINALLNGRWVIFATMLLAATAGLISNYFQALRYQSSAQIQIDAPAFFPSPGGDLNAQNSYYLNIERYFRTEKEKLTSRRMFNSFGNRLKAADREYQARSVESLAGEFAGGFSTEPIEETNLVTLRLVADNPEKAAAWLNIYADLFVEENARRQEENVKQNREYLRAQLDEIKNLLTSQQGAENPQAGSSGQAPAEEAIPIDGDLLFNYQSAYDDARRKRFEEEQKLNRLTPFLQAGADLTNLPVLDFSPSLRLYYEKLAAARGEQDRLRLSGKGEKHPAVVVKQQEIDNLQEQMRLELNKIAESFRLNLAILKKTEASALETLNRKIDERKTAARRTKESTRIDRVRDSWANSSALVEEKLRSLKLLENFVTNNMSVVERARPDPTPVSKRGWGFVLFAAAGGILLGAAIVVAAEHVNPRIKTIDDIQAYLDVPALGYIPRTKDFSFSEIREAYNVLRTEVLYRRDTYKHRSFMVTSSIPQEGKTTVALNLAKTLASAGDRTVLLDFDLRKARLRSLMSSGNMNGDQVFSPVEGLQLRLEATETPTLQIVVPVTLPQQPPFVLSQPEIRDLVEYLRDHYDWVIVDTPPVSSVTDPVIIASIVDTILFVIKHDFVDRKIIRDSLAALSNVNGNIMGAVLNDLNLRKLSYYSYRRYYRYYGETESN